MKAKETFRQFNNVVMKVESLQHCKVPIGISFKKSQRLKSRASSREKLSGIGRGDLGNTSLEKLSRRKLDLFPRSYNEEYNFYHLLWNVVLLWT